ncbi:MAG TPA: hypothetical protein VGD83_14555 [Streptosporangiaceae bacterium]
MNSVSPPPNPSDMAGAGTSPRAPARNATCATTRRSNGVSGPPGVSAGTTHRAGPPGPAGPAAPAGARTSNQPRAARSTRVAPNPDRSSRRASRLTTAGGTSPGSGVRVLRLRAVLPSPWPPPSCGPGEGGTISRTTNRNSHPAPAVTATGNMPFPSDPLSTPESRPLSPCRPGAVPPPYLTRPPPPTGSDAKIDKK